MCKNINENNLNCEVSSSEALHSNEGSVADVNQDLVKSKVPEM